MKRERREFLDSAADAAHAGTGVLSTRTMPAPTEGAASWPVQMPHAATLQVKRWRERLDEAMGKFERDAKSFAATAAATEDEDTGRYGLARASRRLSDVLGQVEDGIREFDASYGVQGVSDGA